MLYAVVGLGDTFKFGNDYGYNLVHLDGSNSWILDRKITNQRWIELAGGVSSSASVAAILDDLYSALPDNRGAPVLAIPAREVCERHEL